MNTKINSMKAIRQVLLLTLFLCLGSLGLSAQEKTQYYYNTHESEILPDANAAFQSGNYDRTITLCRWHYIIVGDRAADSLREKAERCARLSSDMTSLILSGDMDAAFEKAQALLELNPNDPVAKDLVEGYTAPEEAPEEAPVEPDVEEPVVETPEEQPVQDTISVYYPPIPEEVVPEVEPEQAVPEEQTTPEDQTITEEPVLPEEALVWTGPLRKPLTIRTRFVLKAGAALLDMKQLAPGGSLGVYNFGGGRIGAELGAYVCSGLTKASLFGMDASLVFRAANKIYPKAGLGFFSCKSDESTTKGLCGGLGATFIIGRGFCVEAGVKYYPKVLVSDVEMVSVADSKYEFPASREVLAGGIAPMFSIGWAF